MALLIRLGTVDYYSTVSLCCVYGNNPLYYSKLVVKSIGGSIRIQQSFVRRMVDHTHTLPLLRGGHGKKRAISHHYVIISNVPRP